MEMPPVVLLLWKEFIYPLTEISMVKQPGWPPLLLINPILNQTINNCFHQRRWVSLSLMWKTIDELLTPIHAVAKSLQVGSYGTTCSCKQR
jgi:hypothetical protein